ncbi:hypothetical protein [Saccharibacillus alkalitolerans]|uniref:N-acetyltransferase domain-containing protein n=1 Tax=Saccharibacillus alkalitolerans TaxID=2705290 RepID=A0ABX0F379_9BACL|nr:hypothetical protein [Saccharibacillus alkalitolerans]NGZ74069.1 hypothetical protein [Saccharibacillus alkalitolerans]
MPQWYLIDRHFQVHPAKLEILSMDEANTLHALGWERNFSWLEIMRDSSKGAAKKLITYSDPRIQGAISYRHDDNFVFVDLLESAPSNRFKNLNRIYTNVSDVLIGYACLQSLSSPAAEGYVAFDSKTSLIAYYEKRFGAQRIGAQRMMIYPRDSMRIVGLYYR